MKEGIVREMTIRDVVAVDDLLYETWLETYPNEELGITKEEVENFLNKRFKEIPIEDREKGFVLALENLKGKRMAIVAEIDGSVVGYCVAIKRKEKNQLQVIYVLPKFQGRGIGKKLWEESLNFFDKEKKIIVHVASYNKKAMRFYESLGFKLSAKLDEDKSIKLLPSGKIIPEVEMVIEATSS